MTDTLNQKPLYPPVDRRSYHPRYFDGMKCFKHPRLGAKVNRRIPGANQWQEEKPVSSEITGNEDTIWDAFNMGHHYAYHQPTLGSVRAFEHEYGRSPYKPQQGTIELKKEPDPTDIAGVVIAEIWDEWYGKHRGYMPPDAMATLLEKAKTQIRNATLPVREMSLDAKEVARICDLFLWYLDNWGDSGFCGSEAVKHGSLRQDVINLGRKAKTI